MHSESDDRPIRDALIHWYSAYANTLLYTYRHPNVSDALKKAYQCFQKTFKSTDRITLDTADGKVIFNGKELANDQIVLSHFASLLNSRGIKSLSFSDEFSRRAFMNFHKLISEQKLSERELPKILLEHDVANLDIHLFEDSLGNGTGGVSSGKKKRPVECTEFVGTAYSCEEETVPDHTSLTVDISMKSSFMAEPGKINIPGYMSTVHDDNIAEPVREGGSFEPDFSSKPYSRGSTRTARPEDYIERIHPMADDGGETATPADIPFRLIDGEYAERDEQVRSVEMLCEQEVTDNEIRIIHNIAPDHMAHILNAVLPDNPAESVLRRIADVYCFGTGPEIADFDSSRQKIFFEELSPELRHNFWMLCLSLLNRRDQQADQYFTEPSLMPSTTSPGTEAGVYTDSDAKNPAPEPLGQTIGNSDFLFDFVVGETAVLHDMEFNAGDADLFDSRQLSRLGETFAAGDVHPRLSIGEMKSKSVAMIIDECADDDMRAASFDVMIEIIESHALGSDALQKMTGKLTAVASELLAKGRFDRVLELHNALRTRSLKDKDNMYAVSMIRSIFSTDNFNGDAVNALRKCGRQQREISGKFMLALHAYLVPFILDALTEENDPSKRRFMITLLTSVRGDVLPFIFNRLRDHRWYVGRNMLYLLRECHGRSYEKEIKDFLGHKVPLVQLEALRTLLSFQDPEAESYVRKFLKSNDFELRKGAVRLAGAHRIRNAVPEMIRLLKEKDRRGTKFLFKKRIIRMLGRIGDSRAVDPFLKICRSRSIVHREDLERLKVEIFKTIHYYPLTTIGPVIDCGLKSSNNEIVAICNKLIKRYKLTERETLRDRT